MTLAPDLLFHNANVLTLDARDTRAQAIAVAGGRIVAVGSDDEILPLGGRATQVVDAGKKTIVPGLIDTHAHMDREGLRRFYPSLRDCRSITDVQQRLRSLVAERKPGEWIVISPLGTPPYHLDGARVLQEGRYPDRFDLDSAAPQNPVWIRSIWGLWSHAPPFVHVLNTAALHALGIDQSTPPPATTVEIERDARGLTGRILESHHYPAAEYTLLRGAPLFTRAVREKGLRDAIALSLAAGTTGIYEGHGIARELLDVYRDVDESGDLNVRAYLPISPPPWRSTAEFERMLVDRYPLARGRGFGDGRLTVGGLNVACLGAATPELAAITADAWPYTGWAGFRDQWNEPDEYRELCRIAAKHRFRVNTVISLRIDQVLSIWEEVHDEFPIDDLRWVLVHGQMMDVERDIPRIRRLGAVMTTQPSTSVHRSGGEIVGDGDEDHLMPHRDLVDAGIPWSLSTDNKPYELFYTLWIAVTRRALGSNRIVSPRQRVSALEALRALTVAGAYTCFDESRRGSLEVGKLADFVVVSDDPTAVADDRLRDLTVSTTVVDGAVRHR